MPIKDREARQEYDNEWKRQKRAGNKGDEVREYHREYIKNWRANHPQKEYDYRAGKEAEAKSAHKEYYEAHKEQIRERHRKYYEANKEYFKQKSRECYFRTKDKIHTKWQARRAMVIRHYGGRCACCGESHIEFLAIDHIMNDGGIHRKGMKTNIFDWIVKNNFPSGFQVLCHNCNLAKAFYGECPHRRV